VFGARVQLSRSNHIHFSICDVKTPSHEINYAQMDKRPARQMTNRLKFKYKQDKLAAARLPPGYPSAL